MPKEELGKEIYKTPCKEFAKVRLSSLEFTVLKGLTDIHNSLSTLKPRPIISWYLVYKFGSLLYLKKCEIRLILRSLAKKGYLEIRKNGVFLKVRPTIAMESPFKKYVQARGLGQKNKKRRW